MCGICGVVGPARRAEPGRMEAMGRAIRHRGPDDAGTWNAHFETRDGSQTVALAHVRLSILDLSPLGHQPMHSHDGRVSISYNGEIYNFRALRGELEAAGAQFRSECDTEVLLEAWRAWGLDAFDRLIGMFAVAIWDADTRRLVLVRDRVGIKPLYYQHDADGLLLFGSELHAMRQHPAFDPEIDRGALAGLLQHGYVTGPRTIYAHTHRLQPGDALVWQDGKIEVEPFWRLTDPAAEPAPTRFDTAVDGLEAILGDAVEQRLVADVPLGAFLSGGIDSSAVVALMQERMSGPVRTFSIGFADDDYDEAPFARAIADHLGTDHTQLYVDRAQARDVAYEIPALYDEPFGDPSGIPTVLLSRMTREHVTVALSGDGGDELLGGYSQHARLHQLAPLMRLPYGLRRIGAALAPLVPKRSLRRGLEHLGGRHPRDVAEGLLRYFDPRDLAAACGDDGIAARQEYRDTFDAAPADEAVRRSMFADARTYMCDDILTKVDRASMSVALEARVPILDHRVVRYALSLPLELAWHGGQAKAPLREIAYRRIPRQLLDRPKHGFGIPIETLLAREMADWTERYLAPARLAEEGNLDPAGVQRLLDASDPADPVGASRRWFLLCFQRWFAHVHRGEPLR